MSIDYQAIVSIIEAKSKPHYEFVSINHRSIGKGDRIKFNGFVGEVVKIGGGRLRFHITEATDLEQPFYLSFPIETLKDRVQRWTLVPGISPDEQLSEYVGRATAAQKAEAEKIRARILNLRSV